MGDSFSVGTRRRETRRLSYANLSHANLAGADLTDANLSGADLTGADLTDANSLVSIGMMTVCMASPSTVTCTTTAVISSGLRGPASEPENLTLVDLTGVGHLLLNDRNQEGKTLALHDVLLAVTLTRR
jgi:hypothetical protein